jgi:putative cardiolipin synthase
LLPRAGVAELAALHDAARRLEQDRAAAAYVARVRELPFVTELLEGRLELEWTKVAMVSDDPTKGLGRVPWDALLPSQVIETMGAPRRELDLVSPYFVPTGTGVKAFAALVADGVRVRILINSLEATDVDAVHAGYIKHRKPLLRAGVKLYEMRMVSAAPAQDYTGPFGSGASSLHAKTFAADRERIFVGSFNFDPRSTFLNTELGFVIESSALAGRLATLFDESVPERAYEARVSPSGEVFWIEHRDGEPVRHDIEPGATLMQRSLVRVLSWLPIDSLL